MHTIQMINSVVNDMVGGRIKPVTVSGRAAGQLRALATREGVAAVSQRYALGLWLPPTVRLTIDRGIREFKPATFVGPLDGLPHKSELKAAPHRMDGEPEIEVLRDGTGMVEIKVEYRGLKTEVHLPPQSVCDEALAQRYGRGWAEKSQAECPDRWRTALRVHTA